MSTPVRIILIVVLALVLWWLVTRLATNVAEETGAIVVPASTLASEPGYRGAVPLG